MAAILSQSQCVNNEENLKKKSNIMTLEITVYVDYLSMLCRWATSVVAMTNLFSRVYSWNVNSLGPGAPFTDMDYL